MHIYIYICVYEILNFLHIKLHSTLLTEDGFKRKCKALLVCSVYVFVIILCIV